VELESRAPRNRSLILAKLRARSACGEGRTDTILITHKPNIVDGLGKDWFDVREGEASVFRPENGSYALIARIQMDAWPGIALATK
jgi:hypothetical protein